MSAIRPAQSGVDRLVPLKMNQCAPCFVGWKSGTLAAVALTSGTALLAHEDTPTREKSPPTQPAEIVFCHAGLGRGTSVLPEPLGPHGTSL